MTKTIPKVSVLMSAYDSEKYLHFAIESILQQTFIDFEFIIVDDASHDSTLRIIKKYQKKDKRIRIIQNKKNSLCSHFFGQVIIIMKPE